MHLWNRISLRTWYIHGVRGVLSQGLLFPLSLDLVLLLPWFAVQILFQLGHTPESMDVSACAVTILSGIQIFMFQEEDLILSFHYQGSDKRWPQVSRICPSKCLHIHSCSLGQDADTSYISRRINGE